jgi:glycosyltransferase involved in cell wall biosynthesis
MPTPRVTIGTITKDRHAFFPHLIHTILAQDYDRSRLEWLVVEDGSDDVEALVTSVAFARYYRCSSNSSIGCKRNLVLDKARGDFIVWFDDDNYAFPDRITTAVKSLLGTSAFELAGSSEMYVLDNEMKKIYTCGPFSHNHATLGTWCHTRELGIARRFDETVSRGEELSFTQEWSTPILQLPKQHTSISFDHGRNTVSKQHLKETASDVWEIRGIIRDEFSRKFFEEFGL